MKRVEHVSRNLGLRHPPRQDVRDLDAAYNRSINKIL
jgi:hypothetical protein